MKKTLIGILAAALIMTSGTTSAFAAGCRGHHSGAGRHHAVSVCTHKRYTDKNKDGICDKCGGCYTDKNKDGICDNYSSKTKKKNCGRRAGHC